MKKAIIFLLLGLFFAGCSASEIARYSAMEEKSVPYAQRSSSSDDLMEGLSVVKPRYVDIWLNMGENELGAYHLVLHYDPAVVRVHEILPAPLAAPSRTISPLAKPDTFDTGRTPVVGLVPGRTGPKGRIHIAHVLFTPAGSGKSPLSVSIESLYDPHSAKVKGVVEVSASEIEVTR